MTNGIAILMENWTKNLHHITISLTPLGLLWSSTVLEIEEMIMI